MVENIYWGRSKVDAILDGDANGSGVADVDNTGAFGEVMAMGGASGMLLLVDMTFVAVPTDNGAIEVHESDDDVTYTKNATYDEAVTKDGGVTVRTVINVAAAKRFIKVKAASAGATDTIVTTVTRLKKSATPI